MDRKRTRIAALTVLAVLAMAAAVPLLTADDAAADSASQIKYVSFTESVTVAAGSSSSYTVFLTNNYSETRFVEVSATDGLGNCTAVSQEYGSGTFQLTAGKSTEIVVTVYADKYAHSGTYNVTLTVINSNADGSDVVTDTYTMPLAVTSNLSSSEQYNKIMGIFENNLPAPLDQPWCSALITAFIWLIIGYLVMLIAVPLTVAIVMKKDDSDRPSMKHSLYHMCWIIIGLNAIGKGIRVLGINEAAIDVVNIVFYICYIIVGAMVAWRLYLMIVNTVVNRIDRDNIIPGKGHQPSSLIPLFRFIGEIVITIAAIGGVMSLLGFDMTAIITSAGIVSLGITMGAQNILNQFFSGLVILSTRPFKKNDLVQIGTGTTVYRVRRVTVMNTELENWDNTDITIMPNSAITASSVKNITRDTLKSKIHIFIDVAYGTDLNYARKLMMDAAMAHPRVVKDGSVLMPYTRVTDFGDSNIQMRLSAYVDDFNDSGTIGGELRQMLYNRFTENGIRIDYPQVVLHQGGPDDEPVQKADSSDGKASAKDQTKG